MTDEETAPDDVKVIGLFMEQALRGIKHGVGCKQELEWEVKLYDFILGHKEHVKLASDYFKARQSQGIFGFDKRKLVEELGWKIE